MSRDGRRFNPVRAPKQVCRQEHVSASMRRAVRQSSGAKWPSATPAATARPEPVQAPATGNGATQP